MIEIIEAIKETVERKILRISTVEGVTDNVVTVDSTLNFLEGDSIAIYQMDVAEYATICQIGPENQICLDHALTAPFTAGASVQPTFNGQFVQYVTVGSPPSIPKYPAVTIEESGNSNVPLTLGTFEAEHDVIITVWADASTYEASLRTTHDVAKKIEFSLFRDSFPLIKPYNSTPLTEFVNSMATVIKVENTDIFYGASDCYIADSSGRYLIKPIEILADNRLRLQNPLQKKFDIGATVIRPRVHIYETMLHAVSYGRGEDGDKLLLNARLDYSLKIQRNRYREPFG